MKQVFNIGHTDLRLFFNFKNKGAYIWFWLFVLPLVFVYFIGSISRGGAAQTNRKPLVLVENEDRSFMGRLLIDELRVQNMQLLDSTNRETAAGIILVPSDFTTKVLSGETVRVRLLQRSDSMEADTAAIELMLRRASIAMNSLILELTTQTNAGPLTEARFRAAMAVPDLVHLNIHFAGVHSVPTGFNFSLPANLVMYIMLNLLVFGGATMAAERRNGVLRRLSVSPISRREIVMGKIYGLTLLGAVQIVYYLTVGKFIFHVNLGTNLPAVLLALLVFAWAAASLAIFIGSVVKNDDRISGICVICSLLMGALGGCWIPLELAPPAIRTIALALPTSWALQILHQLISFGSNLTSVMLPLLVLAGFACVANFLAVRFFRL